MTGGLAGPSPFAWALSPPLPSEQSIRLGGIKDREILSALILSDWNICRDWCFFSSSLPPAQKSQTNNGRSQKTSHPLARRRRELHHRIAHVLKRYVETNQTGKPETRLSESYLKKLYSEFWPIRKHFFFVRVDDRRKAYRPVYQTVFDIPTALAFFGTNPASTLTCVGRMASAIVASWNNTWSNQPEVLLFLSPSYKSTPPRLSI